MLCITLWCGQLPHCLLIEQELSGWNCRETRKTKAIEGVRDEEIMTSCLDNSLTNGFWGERERERNREVSSEEWGQT